MRLTAWRHHGSVRAAARVGGWQTWIGFYDPTQFLGYVRDGTTTHLAATHLEPVRLSQIFWKDILMNKTDLQRLAVAVGALSEAYRQPITEATIRAYAMGLDDLPIASIESAVRRAFREKKFMPTVSELRELAGDVHCSLADRAIRAWATVERAVVQHGAYRSVTFDDPVVNATIRSLGGWQKCCETPESEFDTFLRSAFLKHYEGLARTGVSDELAAPHIGIFDAENGMRGYGTRQPLLISTGLPPLVTHQPRQSARQVIAPDAAALTHDIGRM